ncbi:hypothetical protein [Cellulophaga baltica]|uniref:hypothetical protein n=1 Tax=Cellulophaga baltica TaxID=76594 RepID=UPI0015F3B944|nr:hypothetical protein [Cellulophaga baltica]MBA6316525.1 hypothetical protein [Cellulophaga baltica]
MSSKNNKPRKKIGAFESEDNKILGLNTFLLKIEKDFFCTVSIVNEDSFTTTNDLVLDVNFNFNLSEGLSILALGKLDGHDLMLKNEKDSFFQKAFQKLRIASNNLFDIKELNLIFKDSTVVVYRIFENSIALELNKLIVEMHNSYVYFTKGLTQLPYEIHVPLLENNNFYTKNALVNNSTIEENHKNYNSYWGLYFDSKVDSDIYDAQEKEIIYGKLIMLE